MSHENMFVALCAITFFVVIGWAPEGRKATSDALHAHKGKN